jgi:hypothetical protein
MEAGAMSTRMGRGASFKPLLAGPLKSQNSAADSLREINKDELGCVVQVVLATLINDAHKAILCASGIGANPIHLPENQGCFIALVVDANCKRLGRFSHGSST